MFSPPASWPVLQIQLAVIFAVLWAFPSIAPAASDRDLLFNAIREGNIVNVRSLMALPGVKSAVAQKENNRTLYFAVDALSRKSPRQSDSTPEQLQHWKESDELQARIMSVLIENGADPNVSSQGSLPLYRAVSLRAPACVKVLLDARANPNINENGRTALQTAAQNGSIAPEIVRMLLDAGADPNYFVQKDDFAVHPLSAAVAGGQWDNRYNRDVERQAETSARSKLENENSMATVDVLLKAGADPAFGLATVLRKTSVTLADGDLLRKFIKAGAFKSGLYTRDQARADLIRAKTQRSMSEEAWNKWETLISDPSHSR